MEKLQLDSEELKEYFEKYEKLMEDKFDSQQVFSECRPYSPTFGRYFVYSDEYLSYDPYGYYKPRLLSEDDVDPRYPNDDDYPLSELHWTISKQFPDIYEDIYNKKAKQRQEQQ